MKKLLFIFLFSSSLLMSQNVISSQTYIQTCYQNQECFSLNNSSYVFYNQSNHELIIAIDFAKFKIGNDTLDEWLDDLDDTKLIFRGFLNTDNLLDLSHLHSKTIVINGLMEFNGVSHPHSIAFTLFEIPQGLLLIDNQNDYFDRINANIQFGFYPKEFKIDKKAHHLKKKITCAIYRGYINPFYPGMEHFISK